MVHITFLIAVAAVSAIPQQVATRHRSSPALLQPQAAPLETDEVGAGVLRPAKYVEPSVFEAPMTSPSESMPIQMHNTSVLHDGSGSAFGDYDSAPVDYVHAPAYYDRTSRRSDDYYHGCEQYIGIWSKHCLPSPWCCPGNMHPHFAYEASPHFYYYFRPYNSAQIGPQQAVAESWVANPRLPYANDVFDEVYRDFDAKFAPSVEPIAPLDPLAN